MCSAVRLSTPAPSEPLPHLSDSANQLHVIFRGTIHEIDYEKETARIPVLNLLSRRWVYLKFADGVDSLEKREGVQVQCRIADYDDDGYYQVFLLTNCTPLSGRTIPFGLAAPQRWLGWLPA